MKFVVTGGGSETKGLANHKAEYLTNASSKAPILA